MAIWWWQVRPRGRAPAVRRLDPARVRAARLGRWRTCVVVSGGPTLEFFHDELAPGDLACLRRTVKASLSARRGPQHVEPV